MTIDEAKTILCMCTDVRKSIDGEIYINRKYVLNILDMIDVKSKNVQENLPKYNLESKKEIMHLKEDNAPVSQKSFKTDVSFGPFTSNSTIRKEKE